MPRTRPPSRELSLLLGWLALAAACCGLTLLSRAIDRSQTRSVAEWSARTAVHDFAVADGRHDLASRLMPLRGRSPEFALTAAGMADHAREQRDGTVVVRTPPGFAAGKLEWKVTLTTAGAVITGIELTPLSPPPPRPSSTARYVMTALLAALTIACAALWGAFTFSALAARPRSTLSGQCALAATILGTWCWALSAAPDDVTLALYPAAAMCVASVALIIWGLPRERRWRLPRHRRDTNTCASCGYNLSGNVSGVCPECGRRTPRGLVAELYPRSRKETAA
jgi:hypothetical protein